MTDTTSEMAVAFDVDLVAAMIYAGHEVCRVSEEGNRIAFWFLSDLLAAKQAELAAGKCRVEVGRWSATVRRLHSEYLNPAAKAAIRSRSRTRFPDVE